MVAVLGDRLEIMFESIIAYLVQKVSSLIDTFSLEPERVVSYDRSILEGTILPYFARDIIYQRILFVGCSAYTQWYGGFFEGKEFWTIDAKRVKRKYGSPHHVVGSITNAGRYFAKGYFDVIIMNGVIGFGLNRIDQIEQAIDACYAVLARQGILLVGWNDTRRRIALDLRAIRALSKFREHRFEPLGSCHFRTEDSHRHTFSFYRKA